MKSKREEVDIIAAYQMVGACRAAADISGTAHKTVKRFLKRREASLERPVRALRPSNIEVVRELVATSVLAAQGRISAISPDCASQTSPEISWR